MAERASVTVSAWRLVGRMTAEAPLDESPIETRWERASHVALAAAALGSLVILAYAINRFRSVSEPRALAWYATAVGGASLAFWASRQPPARRLAVAILALSTVVTLLASEGVVAWLKRAAFVRTQAQVEDLTGIPYDSRSVPEVVQDLWRTDSGAMPAIVPKVMIEYYRDDADPRSRFDGPMLPLASVAHRTTVQICNEDGRYPIFRSDAHGFANPSTPWEELGGGLLLIGDSFVHGYCVPSDSTLAAHLRRRWPHTLNLGSGGSGPLSELAILQEYGLPTRPSVVLWFYYENDLPDLVQERQHPILLRYLDPSFGQGLRDRQGEIDSALVPWVRRVYGGGYAPRDFEEHGLRDLLRLSALRDLVATARRAPDDPSAQLPLFRDVLATAQARVQSTGATMIFAFLPQWERFFAPERSAAGAARAQVLAIARAAGLTVIDLTAAFDAHQERARLFARGDLATAHYSSLGYAFVADAIARRLDSIGVGGRLDSLRGH